MKFSIIPALVAGAVLVQVGASPLRVVITTINEVSPNIRYGHAVPSRSSSNNNVVTLVKLPGENRRVRGPCRGGRLRQKVTEVTNAFRQALGFPLIETGVRRPVKPDLHRGGVRIQSIGPPTFIGTTASNDGDIPHDNFVHILPYPPHPHHRQHIPSNGFRENGPFLQRIHYALTSLGRWEGRAVAFVLGCGIGVLLRMFWVLTIVSYRLIKGTKEDETKYTEIFVVEEYDDEDVSPAPPTYTYSDEKADKNKVVDVQTTEETTSPSPIPVGPPSVDSSMDVPPSLVTPTNMNEGIFSTEFIRSVANSLDEFDGNLFRPDGDINFERDFGQWFNPDDINLDGMVDVYDKKNKK